jgi:hypothetical protein
MFDGDQEEQGSLKREIANTYRGCACEVNSYFLTLSFTTLNGESGEPKTQG